MRRGKEVLNLPIITRDNGAKVGKVEDLILDQACSRVLGLLADEGGWVSSARVIGWASILVVGLDAVIIDAETSVKKAAELPEMSEVLGRRYVLHGLDLQTTEGKSLGRIEEFYFDPQTGVVQWVRTLGRREGIVPSAATQLPIRSRRGFRRSLRRADHHQPEGRSASRLTAESPSVLSRAGRLPLVLGRPPARPASH